MKIISILSLLLGYTISIDCMKKVKKEIPFISKAQMTVVGCSESDCRKLPQATQEAYYMACQFNNLESISKLEPVIEYAMKRVPDMKDQYIRYVFSMTQPGQAKADEEDMEHDEGKKPANSPRFPTKYLFKVCVPVDKEKKSWVDNACALDDCGERAELWNQPCKTTIPGQSF